MVLAPTGPQLVADESLAFFSAQEQLASGIMRLKAFDEEALQSEGIDRVAKLLIGLKESGEVLVRSPFLHL